MHPHRKPTRLAGFDYSRQNSYFVTPIVHGRCRCFGEIKGGSMNLNEFGEITHKQLIWLENQYPYIKIPIWVIMPDHVHAKIEICEYPTISSGGSRPTPTNGIKIKPLPELMGAFKTTSSKLIHLAGLTEFKWQRSFHDRIIRNQIEYWNIYNYIANNPSNWENDHSAFVNRRSIIYLLVNELRMMNNEL